MPVARTGTAALGLVVACGLACSREAPDIPPGAIATASTDPLWALAPPDVELGAVVGDGAATALHSALVTLVSGLERSPTTAALAGKIREELTAWEASDLDDVHHSTGSSPSARGIFARWL